MKANEKPLEAKLRKGVTRLGGLCLKLPAVYFTGIPDRLCLLPGGRAYFVETKSSGKDLSPRQVYVKKLLEGLGFVVFKVDSEEALAEALKIFEPIINFEPPKRSKSYVSELESHFENRRPSGPRFLVKLPGEEAIVEPYRLNGVEPLTFSEAVELEILNLCQINLEKLGEHLNDKDLRRLQKLRSKSALL